MLKAGNAVSGVLDGLGKDAGTIDRTRECQPFRFMEACWVTTSHSPDGLII